MIDNCRFYDIIDILTLITQNGIRYRFLLACTTHLNPIEMSFGEFKANYKAHQPRPKSKEEIIFFYPNND